MGAISHHKVVAALPIPLEADSIYYVRKDSGFEVFVTNALGTLVGYEANYQAKADNLTALAGLTGAADRLPYFTGAGALSLTTLTAAARTLLAATGAEGQRTALGLGTAATANVQTSLTDTTTARLLAVGAFGLGGYAGGIVTDVNNIGYTRFFRASNNPQMPNLSTWVGINISRDGGAGRASQLVWTDVSGAIYSRVRIANGTWAAWAELKTTLNTTVDANGFIKAASPIARVSDSAIEGVGALEKLATGHYRITQTQGLRLGGGWYIETPHDRNGDKYFNVEWYQNTEPLAVDGFLEEEVDGVVIDLHCFERVWNPATGRHENGAPVDIPAGRWIDLRFNELKPDEDELDELVEPH